MNKEEKIFRSVLQYLGYDSTICSCGIPACRDKAYKCTIYAENEERNKIIRTLMINNLSFHYSSLYVEVYSYMF